MREDFHAGHPHCRSQPFEDVVVFDFFEVAFPRLLRWLGELVEEEEVDEDHLENLEGFAFGFFDEELEAVVALLDVGQVVEEMQVLLLLHHQPQRRPV